MSETIDTEVFEKQKSRGGCGKVLLWLFFIALVLSCLCCAGIIGISYHVVNSLKNGLVEDPVVAQEKTEEAFGELSLPDSIKPRAFLTAKLFGKELGFAGIYSWDVSDVSASADTADVPADTTVDAAPAGEDSSDNTTPTAVDDTTPAAVDDKAPSADDNKGAIFFYSLSDALKGNEKEFVDAISQGITENKDKDVTVKRSEKASVTINGKASDFTFSWMESKDKKPFLMVSGSFDSKTGKDCNVLIYLPGEISKETVVDVLENIQK